MVSSPFASTTIKHKTQKCLYEASKAWSLAVKKDYQKILVNLPTKVLRYDKKVLRYV